MVTRSLDRRGFLLSSSACLALAVSGCVSGGDDDGRPSEPTVNETISEETTYTFDLEEGDTIWMEIDDNQETRFIDYEIVPPEGNTQSLSRKSVDESWTAERDGEHQLIISASRETEVRIWVE